MPSQAWGWGRRSPCGLWKVTISLLDDPAPSRAPCSFPFKPSSTNGLGWFKEMKQEVLAHLTHLAGTAVEHAYMSSSTAKPLQEDHGQQQGKQHCRSQGMANSTHSDRPPSLRRSDPKQVWVLQEVPHLSLEMFNLVSCSSMSVYRMPLTQAVTRFKRRF